MFSLPWLWISIVSRHQYLCVVHTRRFKVSGAWGHVGTWRSAERCGDPGRACRLSPGLWRMTSLSVFYSYKKTKTIPVVPPTKHISYQCLRRHVGELHTGRSRCMPWSSPDLYNKGEAQKFSSVVPLIANRGRQIIWISLNAPQKEMETSLFLTDLMVDGSFCQQLSIVDSLSSGENLFSSHEHVIRIGVFLDKNKTNSEIRFFSHVMMTGGG